MSSPHINPPSSTVPSPKRFLPQPIETSSKSRRSVVSTNITIPEQDSQKAQPELAPRKSADSGYGQRFKPEPIETSKRTSKARPKPSHADRTTVNRLSIPETEQDKALGNVGRRKFVPDLIETSRRSRKSRDSASALRFANGIDAVSGNQLDLRRRHEEQWRGLSHNGLNGITHMGSEAHGPRRTTSPRPFTAARQHSFQVPSLEPIESSESDGSRCPSLSTSPTAASDDGPDLRHNAGKTRRMRDESVSGYLLDMAAKAAERQLRDQAMAAFPNSDFHEPVNHFAVDRDSDDSDAESSVGFYSRGQETHEDRARRQSVADQVWDVLEMRKHHEKLEQERRPSMSKRKEGDGHHKDLSKDAFLAAALTLTKQGAIGLDTSGQPKSIIGGWQRGVGLESMRAAANPPMLGGDLEFRMFRSPQATMLDVDQCPSSSLQNLPRAKNGGGLWRGYCVARGDDGSAAPEARSSGIHSPPATKREDGLMRNTLGHEQVMAPTPPGSPTIRESVLQECCSQQGDRPEEEIDREASDEFVTQVYNYLSLGYPSLARKYDDELSRISKIPLEELSRDDQGSEAKGFVGLEEGKGITMEAAVDGSCARWKALRLYIRDWMRQHPDINTGHLGPDAWGVRGRRGSWAI
ncbi:MAG: hypothetical protein M1816_007538 [Peltula sp. TS41687]|nr:MAG: hypothetical protein M1816_007538 [Peltula sp. TS41687]